MLFNIQLILMKVFETLRNEFEEELAGKDARILQVSTFQTYKMRFSKYLRILQLLVFWRSCQLD